MSAINVASIPDGILKAMCVGQLRTIADYFKDPEHAKAFEQWKKERISKNGKSDN